MGPHRSFRTLALTEWDEKLLEGFGQRDSTPVLRFAFL